jgi:hypothetical protein
MGPPTLFTFPVLRYEDLWPDARAIGDGLGRAARMGDEEPARHLQDADHRQGRAELADDRLPIISSALAALSIYISSATMTRTSVPSSAYKLFEEAMPLRKQILCTYQGRFRELCPIILGHSQGREKALTYQFGGQSNKGLPPGGQWRCLWLSEVSNVRLRDGPWHAGDSHNQPQGCVDVVDLDVNPASPYNPKRRP